MYIGKTRVFSLFFSFHILLIYYNLDLAVGCMFLNTKISHDMIFLLVTWHTIKGFMLTNCNHILFM